MKKPRKDWGSQPYCLLYDSNCATCQTFKTAVKALDMRGRIVAVPFSEDDVKANRLLSGLDLKVAMTSFHMVSPSGEIASAREAVLTVMRLLPLGRPFLRLVEGSPFLRRLIKVVYERFAHATHKHRWERMHVSG